MAGLMVYLATLRLMRALSAWVSPSRGPRCCFILWGGLPGSDGHLADAAHGLAVAADHGEGAHVVQDVLGGDGFAADAGFGEGDVLGDGGVEVVADHEHVEVFVEGVGGVGAGGVGAAGEDVGEAGDLDDVGGVAAAGAFGVEGVDGAALEGGDGVLDEAAFVEGVGVDHDLDVEAVGDAEGAADGGGGGAPVLVELEAGGTGAEHLFEGLGLGGVALAGEGEVDGEALGGLEHAGEVPWAGGAGGGGGAGCRACAAADEGGEAGGEGFLDLLGADEVDVGVDAAGGEDLAFAGDDFGAGADDDGNAGLDVGVAGLADGVDAAAEEGDVGFDDAPVVDDEGVGDDGVDGALGLAGLGLAHAVADDLAAAELHFLAVDGVVVFDFGPEVGVGEAGRGRLWWDRTCRRRRGGRSQLAADLAAEAVDDALAAKGDEGDVAFLAGFEAGGGAGGDVEALAAGGGAVEAEGGVGFGEVVVAADLDGAVAGVGDGDRGARLAFVEGDVAVEGDGLAGDHGGGSSDGLVDGDELGAVGKGGFDLDVGDHFGNSGHDLVSGDDVGAGFHEVGDGAAVAGAFNDEVGDEGDGFGVVELDAAVEAAAGDGGGHADQQFVLLAGGQVHPVLSRAIHGAACGPRARCSSPRSRLGGARHRLGRPGGR